MKIKNYGQKITHYPSLFDMISIIFHNVLAGIVKGEPVHMSLGYFSLIGKIPSKKIPSLDEIRKRLSEYEIVFSESAVSSIYIRFKHSNGTDIFKEGEFMYSCRSGSFHFLFNSSGALFDLFSEFDDKIPEFIHHLIKDFPGSNYLPDRELLQELSKISLIDNNKFLEGLNPFQPVIIEVD